jgi:lysophospholipase
LDFRSEIFTTLLIFCFLSASVSASYVPQSVACPTTPLVRPASGISDDEEAYRVARKVIADENLRAWLMETNPGFGTLELPTVSNPSHD